MCIYIYTCLSRALATVHAMGPRGTAIGLHGCDQSMILNISCSIMYIIIII